VGASEKGVKSVMRLH